MDLICCVSCVSSCLRQPIGTSSGMSPHERDLDNSPYVARFSLFSLSLLSVSVLHRSAPAYSPTSPHVGGGSGDGSYSVRP